MSNPPGKSVLLWSCGNVFQEIACIAVSNDGLALPYCHRSLRADRDVVLCAVKSPLVRRVKTSMSGKMLGSVVGFHRHWSHNWKTQFELKLLQTKDKIDVF